MIGISSFAFSFIQANDYNMEIAYEGEGEEAVDSMSLTLLNTDLPYKAISSYKAPSLHSGST